MRIGIDLARVGELDRLLQRAWFRRYVYTPSELRRADGYQATRAAEFLTGRFAAKEAVLKVLGTGIFAGVAPREIELDSDSAGAPVARLTGAASAVAQRLAIASVTVSISHKDNDVVAVAVSTPVSPLDAVTAIDDPRLWAARCSVEASALLLRAYLADDLEALLDAVGAARASVSAATTAAWTVKGHNR
uniref:Holo-[acyl-carrier-protein] synthase n=1 Tax=uncultured soil bacterium TaxID=164851 RepID=E2D2K7_9BACT|nr:hypothetical protein [uncultured soil bacterium]